LKETYPYTYYVTAQQVGHCFAFTDEVFFPLVSCLIASFVGVSVIGHGDPNIAKRHDLLNSQSLVYSGDRQAPPGSSECFQRFDRWQIQADG
jgi:hypothetical protein